MSMFQRLRDVAYSGFFLVHLSATLLFDTQLIFSRSLFPQVLVDIVNKFVKDYKDPLVGNNPTWLKSFIYIEVIFMVPFLIPGIFGNLMGSRWMRTPSIIYGTAVAVMASPMLAHVLFDDFKGFKVGPSTQEERLKLAALYGSFLLGGLVIMLDHLFFRGGPPKSVGYQGKVESGKSQIKKNK